MNETNWIDLADNIRLLKNVALVQCVILGLMLLQLVDQAQRERAERRAVRKKFLEQNAGR